MVSKKSIECVESVERVEKAGACQLCQINCGALYTVEENRIIKVRPDKSNPRSRGYMCRKGLRMAYYVHNADRISYPLKKVDGTSFSGHTSSPYPSHIRVSWDEALDEIAEKALKIREEYGPKAFAYMGGGSMGGMFEGPYGATLNRLLGVGYHYSSGLQEFSNLWWVEGRLFGQQGLGTEPDIEHAETMVVWGWNGMTSHQIPRAPVELRRVAKDPRRTLIVIDPRLSETAEIADIHLPLIPGTDSLLLKAMLALVIEQGWLNEGYLAEHVEGWERVRPLFEGFAWQDAVCACGLDEEKVFEATHILATTKSAFRKDLGLFMNRNSTINLYMLYLLQAVIGRLCVEGAACFGAALRSKPHTDERDPATLRSAINGMFTICGMLPPAIYPEEVLSDTPERIRATFIGGCNPARSYPDSKSYEAALSALELSVSINSVFDETARCCKYVLPARAYIESYDFNTFTFSHPDLYFHLRPPILEPLSDEAHETCQIYFEMAERMGLVPDLPRALHEAAASGSYDTFDCALNAHVREHPEHAAVLPFVVAATLGRALGSFNLAAMYLLVRNASPSIIEGTRTAGHLWNESDRYDVLMRAVLDNPHGFVLSRLAGDQFDLIAHPDKRIHVYIEELVQRVHAVEPASESAALVLPDEYPFILHLGLHAPVNANTLQRNPVWNEDLRWGVVLMSPTDAAQLDIEDGEKIEIATEASAVEVEVEVSLRARPGCLYLQHGFGLIYDGVQRGVNANYLSKTSHRDELGTPLHRRIPCRVAKASSAARS
ncbi:MAG: molybdopterin-dependent oxidoreductase [Coriobacteriales bacterium]|jgi:anaerobic selenocysteine-containing dehydrogenase|nr:molybdopterin-dependent oxidoreductase [Coriobacteriales bacterium]